MLKELLRARTDNLAVQFLRYAVVGGLAFALDFGTLYALTEGLRFHYLVSAAAAFLVGLVFNYILSTFWVFSRRTLANRWAEFVAFAAIGLAGLGLNEIFIYAFTEFAALHYLVSKAAATVLVFIWNFSARRFIIYR
ncbi:MAG: GtrA family protein [Patescibacteria group bacterium]